MDIILKEIVLFILLLHSSFVLSFMLDGVTVATDNSSATVCQDKTDTCSHYGHKPCTSSVYEAWAKENCALYCGFCIPPRPLSFHCEDKISNCDEYEPEDRSLCTDDTYYAWAYEHCKGYCKFDECNGTCEDNSHSDCALLNRLTHVCDNYTVGKVICRKYCGFCNRTDGVWSSWQAWGGCDVTCGNGTRLRTRLCDNPPPKNNGDDCFGTNQDTTSCEMELCPVHGGWSLWSSWGTCSSTCGTGLERRDRYCNNPYPERNGDHCFGNGVAYMICNGPSCSAWSEWEAWGSCSSITGNGIRQRERNCTGSNDPCIGDAHESSACGGNSISHSNLPYTSAFSAKYLRSGSSSYNAVRFSTLLLNEGSDYSSSTGIFTCRIPGLYYFSFTVTKTRGTGIDMIYCSLLINRASKLSIHVDPHDDHDSDYGSYSATSSGAFHLHTNDKVYIGSCAAVSAFDEARCSFTGFLVRPDV